MIIHYSDESLIQGLRQKKESYIRYFYKEYFPVIRSIVERNSGNRQDAEDVFNDGMIVLYLRVKRDLSPLRSSLKTYLYSICKNIWLQRLDRKFRLLYQSDYEVHENSGRYADNDYQVREEYLEKMRLYNNHFLSLPLDCQTLLKLFFMKVSLREIARTLGLKDEVYAKTRKYMCKNMLRKKILNDPQCQQFISYEGFREIE
jgi:RNA polymerase sigma factor (sigma-70 family)